MIYKSPSPIPQQMTIEKLQRSWDTAVLNLPDYAVMKGGGSGSMPIEYSPTPQ